MSKNIQKNSKNVNHRLYHHGLIKILIVEDLHERNDSWDAFLIHDGLVDATIFHAKIPQEENVVLNNNDKI